MAQNTDLVADAQTLLEENLSEKKSVEFARRLPKSQHTDLSRTSIVQTKHRKHGTKVKGNFATPLREKPDYHASH